MGRFELLDEDFTKIRDRLGIRARLPYHNPGRHADYRTCYTDRTAAIVAEVYREGIETFNYCFTPTSTKARGHDR